MMRVICVHCRDSHQYDLTLSINWRSADWNTFSGWLSQLLQKDISTKWRLRCLRINVQKNFNFVVTWMIESISSMEHLATFRETFQKWGQKGADRVWNIINFSKFLTLWYLKHYKYLCNMIFLKAANLLEISRYVNKFNSNWRQFLTSGDTISTYRVCESHLVAKLLWICVN